MLPLPLPHAQVDAQGGPWCTARGRARGYSRQARPRFSRGAYSASAEGPDHEIVPVHHGVHGEVPPVGGGPRPVSGAGPVPAAEARVGGHAGVRGHFELGVDVHADRAADRRRVAYRVAPYLDSS